MKFCRNKKLILERIKIWVDVRDGLLVFSPQLGVGIKHGCYEEYDRLNRLISRLWKIYYKK